MAQWQGLELRLPRTASGYREYQLQFDPGLQSADLWIDGERRLTGYRGHDQFHESRSLRFGAAAYRSRQGRASFKLVRFEINP